ncbi:MAG: Hsp20/alpha crystallin family protein [Blastocatellia bacterium]|nr:Hsp20/alpha crystallin family protein [Blastocatellia bacterium]MBL8193868.1 Hsp20/alpha crystallin family protein [Blastocatellia bacterium]MBN8725296.1 Hsp20/alpha crystallin family protein [Acidobacteriota bacterium]
MSDKLEHLKDLINLQEKMNRLFKEVTVVSDSKDSWVPLVDIYEAQETIVIKVDLPEVAQEDIQVNLDGDKLTLIGKRNLPIGVEKEQFQCMERFYGQFNRQFTLPSNVDPEKINADYKMGVLTITLPKIAPKIAKQIKVKIG